MLSRNPQFSRVRAHLDWLAGAALFLFTLLVYLRTLAPTVAFMFDDSLEFQLLAARMAIAHPTGYPLYSLLIKLATFLPLGDIAYRVNLVSAVSGALAVAFVYLAARELTARFMTAQNAVGAALVRAPAVIAALIFAFGETFWSQAVVAEVYTLQALLTAVMLWLVLRWGRAWSGVSGADQAATQRPSLVPIAFFAGLMLTHHRMSILLFPALALYVLVTEHSFLRRPRLLGKMALAFALPLLLYLYLPLRGMVTSSLDGAYQNTPAGFFNWILGSAYTVFLTQNPLNAQRDSAYYFALFVNEFTVLGLAAAVVGFVGLFLRAWREWLLLALALAANLVFALTYRVADIDVFFIPSFLLLVLFLAAGLSALLWLAFYFWSNRRAPAFAALGALVLLLIPLALYRDHYPRVDLSRRTDVAAYGRELLAQPLAENATIIGILGEMSLVRYFQETQGFRPDVETIAADQEADRTRAVQAALDRGRTVYLTRPLTGIEKQDSLSSVGPLIQILPKPNKKNSPTMGQTLDERFEDVTLLGYTRDPNAADGGGETVAARAIPVTLFWQPQKRIGNNRLVSLKLLDAQGQLAGQIDRQPVLDAYPTSAWRSGEYIADAYQVPIFVGAPPGEYSLQVTLYDPASGKVYGQRDLERVSIPPQTETVPAASLDVNRVVLQEVDGMQLVGYTLETGEPYAPGAAVPLTLLWRAPQAGAMREVTLTVSDLVGKTAVTQTQTLGGAGTAAGQYLRQELGVPLPTSLTAGKYNVRLNVRGGGAWLLQSNSETLGTIEVSAQ